MYFKNWLSNHIYPNKNEFIEPPVQSVISIHSCFRCPLFHVMRKLSDTVHA